MTENEKKHIVNTIILKLPKQDEDFTYFLQNEIGADGSTLMGLKKPSFGTVGACQMPSLDRKGELVGQKRIPISRFAKTIERSYSKKQFFVYMKQENFNALLDSLNADELSLFNAHRGLKKLWSWNGSKFIYHSASLDTFESLSAKVFDASGVFHKGKLIKKEKNRLLQAV